MTLDEARLVLDAARRDTSVPTARITLALIATGDIDGDWSVQAHSAVGTWERPLMASTLRPADPFDGLGSVFAWRGAA